MHQVYHNLSLPLSLSLSLSLSLRNDNKNKENIWSAFDLHQTDIAVIPINMRIRQSKNIHTHTADLGVECYLVCISSIPLQRLKLMTKSDKSVFDWRLRWDPGPDQSASRTSSVSSSLSSKLVLGTTRTHISTIAFENGLRKLFCLPLYLYWDACSVSIPYHHQPSDLWTETDDFRLSLSQCVTTFTA